jgi:hypothetical protein
MIATSSRVKLFRSVLDTYALAIPAAQPAKVAGFAGSNPRDKLQPYLASST